MARLNMANSSQVDTTSSQPGIDSELHGVAQFVHEEFDGQVDPQVVDEYLNKVSARFEGAPVRVFVPLLVRRYAREELMTRLRQTG
jgi:hypothetical protein